MVYCFIPNCNSNGRKEKISFSRIPQILTEKNNNHNGIGKDINYFINLSKKRQKAWIKVIGKGVLTQTQI